MAISRLVGAYLETALWSSVDPYTDEPFDKEYDITNFSRNAIEQAEHDVDEFLETAIDLIEKLSPEEEIDLDDVVYDFWLTRNGHGAGFWDGDYPEELGEALTKLAHSFGEVYVYVGDDGELYMAK